MHHFKALEDYLFLFMLLLQVLQTMKQAWGEINNYNVLIDGRNFYDQSIIDLIKQYDEVWKVSTGQGDDYATCCFLDYAYFKDNYRLNAVDSSK